MKSRQASGKALGEQLKNIQQSLENLLGSSATITIEGVTQLDGKGIRYTSELPQV
jgi:hypothetical protein